jgi:hypothetical protein
MQGHSNAEPQAREHDVQEALAKREITGGQVRQEETDLQQFVEEVVLEGKDENHTVKRGIGNYTEGDRANAGISSLEGWTYPAR